MRIGRPSLAAVVAAAFASLLGLVPSAGAQVVHGNVDSAAGYLSDEGGRLRRLHKTSDSTDTGAAQADDSSSSSGTGSSSASHSHDDESVQCTIYDMMFEKGMSCTTDRCELCGLQCTMNSTVCPDTCTSMADIEDFCYDVEHSSSSGTGTGGTGGTGTGGSSSKSNKDHSGLCHIQCLQYVQQCCPCKSTVTLVDYHTDLVVHDGTPDTTELVIGSRFVDGTAGFPTFNYCFPDPSSDIRFCPLYSINPGEEGFDSDDISGLADPDDPDQDNGLYYIGQVPIITTIASDTDNTYTGSNYNGILGLVFGAAGAGTDVPAGTEAGATVGWDQFLNGVGGCGTRITKVEFATDTDQLTIDSVDLILQDSAGTHITQSVGTSGTVTLDGQTWSTFDPATNEDEHHAGTFGASSSPSFTCVKYVGARIQATNGAVIATNNGYAGFTKFKAYGNAPMTPGCTSGSNLF